MRIFLDVGSHHGQIIDRALNPAYEIDIVYAFEPSPECYEFLRSKYHMNKKIIILNFGLWKKTCEKILYNEGTQGGSILDDYKSGWDGFGKKTVCSFMNASDWFKSNLDSDGITFIKLNCEGCECDIINNLLDTGEFNKLKAMLIDYDVRKSPLQKWQERSLKKRLVKLKIKNVYPFTGHDRFVVLEKVLTIKKKVRKM